MTNAVGVQPFLAEIRSIGASQAKALGEDVADSEAGERPAAVIQKHPRFRLRLGRVDGRVEDWRGAS